MGTILGIVRDYSHRRVLVDGQFNSELLSLKSGNKSTMANEIVPYNMSKALEEIHRLRP
jgi:hypothetical protein